ncbi:MAG: tRNA (adenosine(37)-N6)-threonylcarbamoyltransferase complex dimerization subunit type 1 TsaB [Spirochaetaceae bacterium]|nr:tRNA (adenosine(37)-N6)-threonylcarbamoyltransferase complex dimerization subunit type 1 TsaB [Spirochaetaceae bacterium]
MKALALDTSTGRISAAAYNGSTHASLILNLELRQSEKLLPAVETVLREAELTPADLDFVALSSGPGSFTGLRLGFAALKAFQLSTGCPLYGVPTLQAYFYPFRDFSGTVVPVIDAKKERFYVSIYRNGKLSLEASDLSPEELLGNIDREEDILVTGTDAPLCVEKLLELRPDQKFHVFNGKECYADYVLLCAEEMFKSGKAPMQDYDGPVYIRQHDAEVPKTK